MKVRKGYTLSKMIRVYCRPVTEICRRIGCPCDLQLNKYNTTVPSTNMYSHLLMVIIYYFTRFPWYKNPSTHKKLKRVIIVLVFCHKCPLSVLYPRTQNRFVFCSHQDIPVGRRHLGHQRQYVSRYIVTQTKLMTAKFDTVMKII